MAGIQRVEFFGTDLADLKELCGSVGVVAHCDTCSRYSDVPCLCVYMHADHIVHRLTERLLAKNLKLK